MKTTTRREALKHLAITPLALGAAGHILSSSENMEQGHKLKGNINHSVCQWTYNFLPLDQLCQVVKKIGFNAIDIIALKDWHTLQKYGIFSSMCYINVMVSLNVCFNNITFL